jgi:hypothetical protein
MDEMKTELYKQIRTHEDKYTYFLLAIAASAIAFSMQQVHDRPFSFGLIPLALSVLLFGFSFYFGCKNLQYISINLFDEFELNKVIHGEFDFDNLSDSPEHLKQPNHPDFIESASKGLKRAIKEINNKIYKFSQRQFFFLIAGAVSYVLWNIVEMWIRSQCIK